MAGVISISSDEESTEDPLQLEPTEPPQKKLKSESVICLDDDEEMVTKNDTDNGKDITDIKLDASSNEKIKNEATKENKTLDEDGINIVFEPGYNVEENSSTSEDLLAQEVEDIDTDWNTKDSSEKTESEKPQLDDNENKITKMFEKNVKMQEFVNLCLQKITSEETKQLFVSKLPFCKKLFDKIDEEYIRSEQFNEFLEEQQALSENSSLKAITSFNDIYQHLKSRIRSQNDGAGPSSENAGNHDAVIAKLEHALRKVQKVIKKLEEAEVNFDEEEDSTYIKMQRYRERAVNLHVKICKYRKEDANANNILYNRLDFAGSTYQEFNQAINKKFKNNTIFPTYFNVEQILRKVMKNKGISLSESAFKQEARDCFKKLGNLLQKRRKLDLLNIHSSYLATNDDPAFQDEELESKLQESSREATSKIEEICQKYVKLQETGQSPELSSDSDDSKRKSTEDENEEEEDL